MANVHAFKSARKVEKVDRLPQECPEAGNGLSPSKQPRQGWIHGDESKFNVRIILPQPQKQLGLNCLSANVAQAGRDDGDPESIPGSFHLGLLHSAAISRPFLFRSDRQSSSKSSCSRLKLKFSCAKARALRPGILTRIIHTEGRDDGQSKDRAEFTRSHYGAVLYRTQDLPLH